MGDVKLPTLVFDRPSLISELNTEFFTHPNCPPFFAVSDMLYFNAVAAKPFSFISFFILLNFV